MAGSSSEFWRAGRVADTPSNHPGGRRRPVCYIVAAAGPSGGATESAAIAMVARKGEEATNMNDATGSCRIGVDIGGTFTDIVALGADGSVLTRKVSSTPDDYGQGILDGLDAVLREAGVATDEVDDVVHATTVATNAILEGTGAKTGLVTTAGFRDVLEMRRIRVPDMYNLDYRKPAPLVPRRLRREVVERLGARGEVRIPLDEGSARAAARRLRDEGVESVAIALLHAYANPAHERRVAEILREEMPAGTFISCSHDVLPEIREYERTSTTIINALLGPIVSQYLAALAARLQALGIARPLQIMQSNGGLMSARRAADTPARILESGPAAGVIAAARVARLAGAEHLITLDMGGTTAKTAIIEDGEPAKTTEYEVGAGINLSSRLLRGAGYAVKLPFVDVSEIGAGGGSKVSFDQGGLMQVGPQSAGSVPGPVCYGTGGDQVTLTDALVTLGYLNPDHLLGGDVALDAGRAARAIDEQVCARLGRSRAEAAHGIYTIAASNMMRAVKAVSTFRGRDPREFTLFAFGGNGPVIAMEIARELEMPRVLVPPGPGVFSALGLLLSDPEHESLQTLFGRLDETAPEDVFAAFERLESEMQQRLVEDGHDPEAMQVQRFADLRYARQAFELTVPLNGDARAPTAIARMESAFHEEHLRTYGHKSEGAPVEMVNIRIRMTAPSNAVETIDLPRMLAAHANGDDARPRSRMAWFGPDAGSVDTPVVGRRDLVDSPRAGPLIVEEYDATCIVLPGYSARVDAHANIDIRVEE